MTEEVKTEFIDLWFIDLLGVHRVVTVSREVFVKGLREGYIPKLDGSSVYGFVEIESSDLYLRPDFTTYVELGDSRGVVFCNVMSAEGLPLLYDPRSLALSVESKIRGGGLEAVIGPEIEFFVFDKVKFKFREPNYQFLHVYSRELEPKNGDTIFSAKTSYFTSEPIDTLYEYRSTFSRELEKYGLKVECHHHEVARGGQVEVIIKRDRLVRAGDSVVTLKYVARTTASKMGKAATFMPKPLYGLNGSGMHTHLSLWRDGSNLFYDPSDEYAGISQACRYFIGGLLEHGRALSPIVSPTVNSYKRLVPGYEAPIYLTWGKSNRSAAVRVPIIPNGERKRVEYRPPDPTANPYLAFVALIAAGLDGLNKKIDPGDPVDENVYKLSEAKKRELNIRELPRDLKEAIEELRCDSEFLKNFIPKEVLDRYLELKEEEWRRVEYRVSPVEYLYYFNL